MSNNEIGACEYAYLEEVIKSNLQQWWKKTRKEYGIQMVWNIGRFVIKRMNIWNSELFLNSNGIAIARKYQNMTR